MAYLIVMPLVVLFVLAVYAFVWFTSDPGIGATN